MGEGGVLSEERGEAEVEVSRRQLHLQSPEVGHRVEGAGLKSEQRGIFAFLMKINVR